MILALSFDVKVTNEGEMDAKVADVSLVGLENFSDSLTYEVTGINVGDIIASGDSIVIKVNIMSNYVYDAELNYQVINVDKAALKVNFLQA